MEQALHSSQSSSSSTARREPATAVPISSHMGLLLQLRLLRLPACSSNSRPAQCR
jgi:hypothetical protein